MGKGAKEVRVKRIYDDAVIPEYESKGASGFDLRAIDDVTIPEKETKLIGTGLSFSIPQGYELQIRPRSGLSFKTKLRVANTPGTIDSDYRGEVKIIMENIGDTSVLIEKGERVAQAVLAPVTKAIFLEEEELSETERGNRGFGSTGTK